MQDQRLVLNSAEVVSKILDGEAIIMNLSTGVYYSTAAVGAFIWECIQEGRSTTQVVAALRNRYDVDKATAEADVERLVTELCGEQLVTPAPEEPQTETAAEPRSEPLLAYEPPALQVYRDMRDLLALDPPMPVLGQNPPADW